MVKATTFKIVALAGFFEEHLNLNMHINSPLPPVHVVTAIPRPTSLHTSQLKALREQQEGFQGTASGRYHNRMAVAALVAAASEDPFGVLVGAGEGSGALSRAALMAAAESDPFGPSGRGESGPSFRSWTSSPAATVR